MRYAIKQSFFRYNKSMALKIIFLAVLFSVSSFSQEQTMTLQEAWSLALANNQTLKAREYEKKQYEYSYLSSLNSYLPQVSISHSFSRSGGDSSSVSDRFSASLSASQELINLKTLSSIKQSKYSFESAEINYRTALCDLRQNLAAAYVNLYFAQETVEVSKRILEIRQENARLIKLKYDSGMESKGNMLYARAQAEMSAMNLRKAQRDLENYMEELFKIIGLAYEKPVKAQYSLELPSQAYDYEYLKKYSSAYPDLKSYEKSLQLAKERLSSARYDALPSLRASGSWGYSGSSEFPDSKSWSLGLSLSLPIFSNGPGYYYSNTSALKNSLKSAEEKLKDAQLGYEKDLKNYNREYENSLDNARTYASLKDANEERYKEGQIQYMAGNLSFIDLENLEQNMIDSRLNYLNYIKNAQLKKLALERLLGKDTI